MDNYKKVWAKSGRGRLWEVVAYEKWSHMERLDCTVKPPLTVTSLQWPLYFVPADSPYIDSYLNLSTTATATKTCPQLLKYPLDNGQFFQRLMKKSEMVVKFDPYGTWMINCGNRILILFHLYCCSKH